MAKRVLTGSTKAGGDYNNATKEMYTSGGGMDKATGHPRKRILSGPKDGKGYQQGNKPLPVSGADNHNPKLGDSHKVLDGKVTDCGYQEGHMQSGAFSDTSGNVVGSRTPAKNAHGFRHEGGRIQGALRLSGHPGASRIGASRKK